MKSLGERLLSKQLFTEDYQYGLMCSISNAVRQAHMSLDDYPLERLPQDLEREFRLQPIELGRLQSVAVFLPGSRRRTHDGIEPYWVAEARVSYRGTPSLWKARPTGLSSFPYRGRAAKASIGLRAYVNTMNLAPFADEVERVLDTIREPLAAFAPRVRSWDAFISERIEDCLRIPQ